MSENQSEVAKEYQQRVDNEGPHSKLGKFYRRMVEKYRRKDDDLISIDPEIEDVIEDGNLQEQSLSDKDHEWVLDDPEIQDLIEDRNLQEQHLAHLVTLSQMDKNTFISNFHNYFSYRYPDTHYAEQLDADIKDFESRLSKKELSDKETSYYQSLLAGSEALKSLLSDFQSEDGNGRIVCFNVVRAIESVKSPTAK